MNHPPRHNTLEAQIERYAARLAELRDEARISFERATEDINRECYRERAMTYDLALHDLACYTNGAHGERNHPAATETQVAA